MENGKAGRQQVETCLSWFMECDLQHALEEERRLADGLKG